MVLTNLGIAFPLRRWQEHAVKQLLLRMEEGETRICLVAPPGAGKTVCSLAVAVELGRFVEVRVPTTALVMQWTQRIETSVISMLPKEERGELPFRVATYASNTPIKKNALLILDEAHHLTSTWGKWIEKAADGSQLWFGLTATPPFGSKDWNRFLELFGTEPVEIPAPPLVRDGQLCPFQDLVWPVLVDVDDIPLLQEITDALQEVEDGLGLAYRAWQDRMLREKLWALTEDYFSGNKSLLVALCRLQNAMGRDLPADIYPDEELLECPTLHDRAFALWSFGQTQNGREIDAGLRDAGFRIRKSGPSLVSDVAWKALSGAGARVRGAIEILSLESKARGDGLRALIVCDRDVEGDVLSARQILRALVANPETDKLDPILVSGTVFWVDDDLWERIQSRLPPMPWVEKEGHYELSVAGWTTAERVSFATQLLTEGFTRCLVGTRHLLGEGWDCPVVSCVIDLTGIAAFVTVNQIRGRALRPDPADLSKVASLWDVISLAPGISDGDRMLKQLVERHEHTFGIDDQGIIRSGVGRIDPVLSRSLQYVAADVDRLQEHMAKKLDDIAFCIEKWAIGANYLDARCWKANLGSRTLGKRCRLPEDELPEIEHQAVKTSVAVREKLAGKKLNRNMVGSVMGCGVFWGGFGSILLGMSPLLGTLAGLGLGILGAIALKNRFQFEDQEQEAIVQALYETMKAQDSTLGDLHSEEGTFWVDADHGGEAFANALAVLLGPIRYPRYLLVDELGRVFPIPEELSMRRDLADSFADNWSKHVCSCSAIYARSKKGKAFLRRVWKLGNSGCDSVEVVELWE